MTLTPFLQKTIAWGLVALVLMVGALLIGPVFTEPARAIADHQIAARHMARVQGIMASRDNLEKSLTALDGTDIDTALLAGSDDQASIELQQAVRQIAQRTGLGIGTLKTLGTDHLDAGFGRVGLRFATTTNYDALVGFLAALKDHNPRLYIRSLMIRSQTMGPDRPVMLQVQIEIDGLKKMTEHAE